MRPPIPLALFVASLPVIGGPLAAQERGPTAPGRVEVRGIYGGVPTQILDRGTLAGRLRRQRRLDRLRRPDARARRRCCKRQGAKVFAEFNTMHEAGYLKDHPDAAPVGTDGKPCPPPDGWQGVCPTHPGYREARMEAFRKALQRLRDRRHLARLPPRPRELGAGRPEPARHLLLRPLPGPVRRRRRAWTCPTGRRRSWPRLLLGPHKAAWVEWRCGVFTDWVREFRAIRDEVRPGALLGTFHCPWTRGRLRRRAARRSWPST